MFTKCKYCPTNCEHINDPFQDTCYCCCRDCEKKEEVIEVDKYAMIIEEEEGNLKFEEWLDSKNKDKD